MKIQQFVKKVFPERKKDSQKKDYGHVLVIAGSKGMSGAGVLASLAALRSGAGLVTLAVPERIQDVCASQVPEIMTLGLENDRNGMVSAEALKRLLDFILRRKIDFVACGPGLGVSDDVLKLVVGLITEYKNGLLLDADAVNCLSIFGKRTVKPEFDVLKNRKGGTVITPHPGEMARIMHTAPKNIQYRRKEFAKNFARMNNLVCVLKGSDTVVTDGKQVYINKTGNPGMATAGSGDVLTGIISGIAACGGALFHCACAGVYIHGSAADIAAKQKGTAGMIASDITEYLPAVIKKYQR